MPFVQMENISNFLAFCGSYGLKTHDLFQTVDLFEAKNMGQVVKNILALKRASGGAMRGGGGKPAMVNVFEGAAANAPAAAPAPSGGGGGGGAKFCSNCGTKAAGGKFCASCGTAL
jgi:Calponin homology (CH) domain